MAAKKGASNRPDIIAIIGKQTLPAKLGILAGAIVVIGLLYWQLFYASLSNDLQAQENQRTKLLKEEKRLKDREKEWLELVQRKEELDEQLKDNQVTLPATSELPAFYQHLQKQAAASGVTIKRWARRKESAVETYVRVPVSVELTGTFYQINRYFWLLSQTDRIITIENLSLKRGSTRNDEILLNASFNAVTFRQKDRPPDTSIEEEPEPEPVPAAPPQGTAPAATPRAADPGNQPVPAPEPGSGTTTGGAAAPPASPAGGQQ